jgi:hypothetical protein
MDHIETDPAAMQNTHGLLQLHKIQRKQMLKFAQDPVCVDPIGLTARYNANPLAFIGVQRHLRNCEMTTTLSDRCPSWAFPP